jgi:acyl transferase domain-containing protein
MRVDHLPETTSTYSSLQKTPIAIVGMASIFPQAENIQQYWDNIISEVDCITEVPPSHWNIADYYDPDPNAPDKTYSKRGGFIPYVDFNPMDFGIPPNILEATDISQLLSLVVAKAALEDAGYGNDSDFNREQTGVILGVTVGRQLSVPLGSRLQYPIWERVLKNSGLSDEETQQIIEKIKDACARAR